MNWLVYQKGDKALGTLEEPLTRLLAAFQEVLQMVSKDKDVTWRLEPHTKAKHILLQEYLKAWFGIMAQTHPQICYVDGFAGPGIYLDGEIGSPLIALNTAYTHKLLPRFKQIYMVFIENQKERAQQLKESCAKKFPKLPPNIHYDIRNGSFSDTFSDIFCGTKSVPSLVFIDPFGVSGIPFTIIKRILQQPSCEVLINFMYDTVNRFATVHKRHLNEMFGCEDWKMLLTIADTGERKRFLSDLYFSQLRTAASAKYVRSLEICDASNRTKYFLFFATNRIEGLREMKRAMWKVDPDGLFRFSAYEESKWSGQLRLFEPEQTHCTELAKSLVQNFQGKEVTIDDIETFVIAKTPYPVDYVRKSLKIIQSENLSKLTVTRPVGKNKGFPKHTRIAFSS